MTAEVQSHIQKYLYNLSNEDYANATREIEAVVSAKQKERFDTAYAEIEQSVKK
jgi:hypothetical protein